MTAESQRIARLLDAHNTRLRALLDADTDTLREVVDEDMIYISSTGSMSTRGDVLEAFARGRMRIDRMEAGPPDIRLYGEVGIVIYDADVIMIHGDTRVEGATRSTTIYYERDGRWQMVSQHQSRIE
ncbi:MAG: nuclear transport factor 2 family protein [Gammaproteobacteria bacterium]|nr:nuclear transport factor 2 family protein [Gammaproteobacteria bacterium]